MQPSEDISLKKFSPGWQRYLLLSAAIVTVGLIVLGNIVRVSNPAQGCPDWPTCFGQWSLPPGTTARIEYFHRIAAIISFILILVSAVVAVFKLRRRAWVTYPLVAAVGLSIVEAALGSQPALIKTMPSAGAVHLGLALVILALVLTATIVSFYSNESDPSNQKFEFSAPIARLAFWVLLGTFLVLVSGVFLAASGAGPACAGWPLCSGVLPGSAAGWLAFGHRVLTGLVSLAVLGLMVVAWQTQRRQRVVLTAATAVGILYFSEVFVGMIKVSRGYPADLVGLHAITAAALWAALITLVLAAGLERDLAVVSVGEGQRMTFRQRFKDYLTLTKPVIVILLLVTTYAGMVVGGRGLPSLSLTFLTLLGGALAAGGSSAINQYIDRDLDKNMQRTAKRPLAAGRLYPAEGLAFGVALCLLSFYLMAGLVNMLAAVLSLAGMIYYVLLYSILLKRVTVQNIVIGGGAGAIPPLVGWAAAAGHLNIPSLFLFAIIFFWTPPHFWALALVRRNDYARAGVPMLPVVRGEYAARVQIFIYTLELVGLTILMPVLKLAGGLYLVSAVVLGGLLIFSAWRVLRKGGNKTAWMMYRYSSMYLALLFFAMVLDVLI